ncbi:MAG: hypothetical protein ACLQUY_21655 [Ktedonobacterales bacterium]
MIQQRSVGGSAFLWGSILGCLVVLLDVVDRFLLGGVERLGPAVVAILRRRHLVVVRPVASLRILMVEGIVLLITLLLFLLAGALAAHRASAIEAGISAGVVAGAIVAVAHMVIVVVTILLAAHPAVLAGIVRGLVVAFLAFILAIGMGAIGALIGARGVRAGGTTAAAPATPNTPAGPGAIRRAEATPVLPAQLLGMHTPTPYHYGPENDYPTAPLKSSSD